MSGTVWKSDDSSYFAHAMSMAMFYGAFGAQSSYPTSVCGVQLGFPTTDSANGKKKCPLCLEDLERTSEGKPP